MRGKFITFEGIDGAGKSTHLEWFRTALAERLASTDRHVITTREPGGTPLGETLRELLLHRAMHLETEALLMFASRSEHLHALILPALARGDWVLSDRFTDASFAYQGAGRGLANAKLNVLESWVQQELQPDLTILFDVPVEIAAQRIQKRISDKFESESLDFFNRVRVEYLRRASEDPMRFAIVDTTRDVDTVRGDLGVILDRLLA